MRRIFFIIWAVTCGMNTNAFAAAGSLPDTNLKMMLGQTSHLGGPAFSDGKTGPLLIQFWASWCHRCSTMFGELGDFSSEQNLPYLAISIDKNPDDARTYLKKHAALINRYKNISFISDKDGQIAQAYEITSVPQVILVAPDGTVLARSSGHFTKSDLFDISRKLKNTGKGVTL